MDITVEYTVFSPSIKYGKFRPVLIDVYSNPPQTYWLHRARKWEQVIEVVKSQDDENAKEKSEQTGESMDEDEYVVSGFLHNLTTVTMRASPKDDNPWTFKTVKYTMQKEVLAGVIPAEISDDDVPESIKSYCLDFFKNFGVQEAYQYSYTSTTSNPKAEELLTPLDDKEKEDGDRVGLYCTALIKGFEENSKVIVQDCLENVLVSDSCASVLNMLAAGDTFDGNDIRNKAIPARFRDIVYGPGFA